MNVLSLSPLPSLKIFLLFICLGACYAGCSQRTDEQPTRQQTEDIPLQRQDSTENYSYYIQFPTIIRTNRILRDTLIKIVEEQEQSFIVRALKDTMQPERPPWELQLEVTVQDSTRHFTSLLGEGYKYMGGAHGAPRVDVPVSIFRDELKPAYRSWFVSEADE